LLNSHDQELILGDSVEIRKQSALDEAERPEPEPEPEPEPRDRTVTVLKLRGGIGLTETGIKMSENCDWNEQRTAATGQRIVRKFAFRGEILEDKKGPLSS
jgi:hypothetical protein